MNKIFIFAMLALLLLVPASAVERQQSGDTAGHGLTISVPEQWTFAQYQNTTLRFYVHNTSNYALLTNLTTDCSIYLYRPDGTYILGTTLSFDTPIHNFYIFLDGELYLTHLERQHFYVYCNSTAGASGFVESYFDVTQNGYESPGNNLLIFFFSCFIALFIASLYLLFYTIQKGFQEDFDIKDLGMNLICYFMLFVMLYFNQTYIGDTLATTFLNMFITIGAVNNMIVPILAFLFTYFKTRFRMMERLGKGDY